VKNKIVITIIVVCVILLFFTANS